MIVDKDTTPRRKIYYLGAKVLEIISGEKATEFEFFNVFEKINENEKTSVNLFSLTLDWLFILGVIKFERGLIKKCF